MSASTQFKEDGLLTRLKKKLSGVIADKRVGKKGNLFCCIL